jgi:hypothetical protein
MDPFHPSGHDAAPLDDGIALSDIAVPQKYVCM